MGDRSIDSRGAQTLAKPGHRVLSAAKEFPSATLPWLNEGAEISFLGLDDDGSVNVAAADSLIDSNTIARGTSRNSNDRRGMMWLLVLPN